MAQERVAQVGWGVPVPHPRLPYRAPQQEPLVITTYLQRPVPLSGTPFSVAIEAKQHEDATEDGENSHEID